VTWHLLAGGTTGGTYHYYLLEPVADNEFRTDTVLYYSAGVSSGATVGATDDDCDGLDEIILSHYPQYTIWDFDTLTQSLQQRCITADDFGSVLKWFSADLDWDGSTDWLCADAGRVVRVLKGGPCTSCEEPGVCIPPPTECVCVCHADPVCDGVMNVLDVVSTVDVVFRNSGEQTDPGPLCATKQTDVNCDFMSNIVDVVRIINVAFRNGDPAIEFCDPCSTFAAQ
jgi:hypothetical protein